MPHRGSESPACYDIWLATFHITERLYDTPYPEEPLNEMEPEKTKRNTEIRQRYRDGELLQDLAQLYDISGQRVSQILRRERD